MDGSHQVPYSARSQFPWMHTAALPVKKSNQEPVDFLAFSLACWSHHTFPIEHESTSKSQSMPKLDGHCIHCFEWRIHSSTTMRCTRAGQTTRTPLLRQTTKQSSKNRDKKYLFAHYHYCTSSDDASQVATRYNLQTLATANNVE